MMEAFYAPRFDIRISGLRLAADISAHVLSLTVETDLDLAGSFAMTLRNADNQLLDSPLFDLGKTVEIYLGYGNQLEPMLLGEITSIQPAFPEDGAPTVRIGGYDKSYKLRRSQPAPVEHPYANDSLIAAYIAAENGLIPVVDPTPDSTPNASGKIRQVESDMAFLKARASKYFFDVYVDWDRLHFQFPRPQVDAHVLEWGRNLRSFSPRISASALAGLQIVRGYNQELAQTLFGLALAGDLDRDNLVERLGSSALDLLKTLVRKGIRKETITNPLDAKTLATSLLRNILEGMYEGSGACIGIPELRAGKYIVIEGVGKRFSGTFRLRKVTHTLDQGGYRTDFEIAQGSHTSLLGLLRHQMIDEPSPNQPERFFGVVVGEVQPPDPEAALINRLGAVKVSFPGLAENITGVCAPCAMPMTGDGMGFYALPEPGTQVLVAFEHGQLDKPYVVGSLWNAKQKPPVANSDGANNVRVIKSRAGHRITFDDTGNQGKLVIEGGGSSITLDAETGDVTISAKGKLTIKAGGDISLEAAGGKTTISMSETEVNVT